MFKNKMHLLLGVALMLLGAVFVITLVVVYSEADTVTTQTTINNQNPAVNSIYVSSTTNGESNDYGAGLGLISSTTKTIHVNGVVSDANGQGDINNVEMIWYRSSVNDTCSADNNDCYKIASCQLSANNDTSKKYNCSFDVQFYADSTDPVGRFSGDIWKSKIIVTDKNSGSGNLTSDGGNDVEINTLLSLNIPSSINYGTLSNNAQTDAGGNQDMVITQAGNDQADVEVSGTALTCSGVGASIPENMQKWSLSDVGFTSTDATALSTTATDTNLGVGYRDNDGAPQTKTLTWNISVPYDAVGTCTGTNTISAIAA